MSDVSSAGRSVVAGVAVTTAVATAFETEDAPLAPVEVADADELPAGQPDEPVPPADEDGAPAIDAGEGDEG